MGFDKAPVEFRFGGGINLVDAPDQLARLQQTRQATNCRIAGRGWISTRKAGLELLSIASWTVIAILPYNNQSGVAAVLLEWDGSATVRLATVDGDGQNHTVIGDLPGYETGVTSRPEMMGVVLAQVLFMCDTARARGLVVYDPNDVLEGATISATFNSGSEEPAVGDTVVGATSGATGTVAEAIVLTSGTWGGGNAAGTIRIAVKNQSGTFQNGENLNISGGSSNVLTLTSVTSSDPAMYQPTFDFNSDLTFAVAKPRVIAVHENHLWMFGYGDSSTPDRGELGRFSFLGLLDDAQGSGDAGTGGRSGSLNLFDIADFVPIGAKDRNVVSAGSAPGRLGIAMEDQYSVVYGTDRSTWRQDILDRERGSVSSLAMVEGDGVLYHWSPLGPARYRGGGQLEDLSRLVDPLIEDIDFGSLFAVHMPQENQVRWYYRRRRDVTDGADRWVGFNYLHGGFEHDELGYRSFSAGFLLPAGTEGPAAAPSSLTHEAITRTSARATWTPGDTAPGVITRVYRAPDVASSPGTFLQVAELKPGGQEYTHVGLEPGTAYWTRVEHFRNGQVSAGTVQATFTTLAALTVPVPLNLAAESSPVLWEDGASWITSILVTFDPGGLIDEPLYHTLQRRIGGGAWTTLRRLEPGRHWFREYNVTVGSFYEYQVRSENEEADVTSAYTSAVAVTPDALPYEQFPEDEDAP